MLDNTEVQWASTIQVAQATLPPQILWNLILSQFFLFRTHQCSQCHHVGHKDFCQGRKFQRPARFNSVKTKPLNGRASVHSFGFVAAYRLNMADHKACPSRNNWSSSSPAASHCIWDIHHMRLNVTRTGEPPIQSTSLAVTSAYEGVLELTGQLHCTVNCNGNLISAFVTAKSDANWLEDLSLSNQSIDTFCQWVQKPQQRAGIPLKQFPSVFEDIGRCTQHQTTIQWKKGSQLVFSPKRPVLRSALPLKDQGILVLVQLFKGAATVS